MPVALDDWITEELLDEARAVGKGRYEAAVRLGRAQPYGDPGDHKRIYLDVYSALAEALVAAWLRLPWVNELVDDLSEKPPDVGTRTDVKWTHHEQGHLIVHDADLDDRLFVLVRREIPDMEVVGWTVGSAAKLACFQGHARARNPDDYWVPARLLLLPELLLQMRKTL